MSNTSKIIGSTLILVGTTVGAGILALPIVSAFAEFKLSIILLIAIWALMTVTALLTLELTLAFDSYRNNFSSMALATVGRWGATVTWLSFLLLLYAVSAAYIAGSGSLLSILFKSLLPIKISPTISALLFTVVLGSAVFWGTKAVDHANRGLISLKGLLLISTLVLLMPHISISQLVKTTGSVKYLWAAAPIFVCSFTLSSRH